MHVKLIIKVFIKKRNFSVENTFFSFIFLAREQIVWKNAKSAENKKPWAGVKKREQDIKMKFEFYEFILELSFSFL